MSLENEKGFARLLVAALEREDVKWATSYATVILSGLKRNEAIDLELNLPKREVPTCADSYNSSAHASAGAR